MTLIRWFELVRLRFRKLFFSAIHPCCWKGIRLLVFPSMEHYHVIMASEYDFIIDAGANRGQFALLCKTLKPSVPIVSFEPVTSEAKIYAAAIGGASGVILEQCALGENSGNMQMHLSRSRDSSSLLPFNRLQAEVFSGTDEIGVEMVKVKSLDECSGFYEKYNHVFLKIDVQGFELEVLKGAKESLRQCAYVYVECSGKQFYKGQAIVPEIEAFLIKENFTLKLIVNEVYVKAELLQGDYLFERTSGLNANSNNATSAS